jgi:D-glycero-D-manno-heptose 1,7-bisphosphate phosphatase
MYNSGVRPAVFLDRDGVIIQNREAYVRSWEDVEFLPHSLEAMSRLAKSPFVIVIVTNQSAVGRGIIPLSQAEMINRRVLETIARAGGRVDGVYMCPHAPEENCTCRKPKAGLLTQAAEELGLDLGRSILIGDALTDLEAAHAAGVPQKILLLTGRGADQVQLLKATNYLDYTVHASLGSAVQAILEA